MARHVSEVNFFKLFPQGPHNGLLDRVGFVGVVVLAREDDFGGRRDDPEAQDFQCVEDNARVLGEGYGVGVLVHPGVEVPQI